MKSIIRVLPRTFRDGSSVTHEYADLQVSRANAEILRLIAERALRLEAARKAASATAIAADDFAAGALRYSRFGVVGHWLLKSVSFDCVSGRPPRATVFTREGLSFQLDADGPIDWTALAQPTEVPLDAKAEVACACGFVNARAALAHPVAGGCLGCSKPIPFTVEVAG